MKRILQTILVFSAMLFALPAAAQTDACAGNSSSIICALGEQVPCMKTGSCASLDSILQVFAVIAQWLLGLAGSLMLLMFVWGGAEWVFSRGESGMVKSGKEKMTNSVIGIVLMFSALAIVRSIRVGLLPDSQLVQCVVDTDCGTTNLVCSAGQCITKAKAAEQNKPLGCTVDNDCNENGTKPGMGCVVAAGGNRCGTVCEKTPGAACQGNPTGASGGTNPCGAGYETIGNGLSHCGDETSICCHRL